MSKIVYLFGDENKSKSKNESKEFKKSSLLEDLVNENNLVDLLNYKEHSSESFLEMFFSNVSNKTIINYQLLINKFSSGFDSILYAFSSHNLSILNRASHISSSLNAPAPSLDGGVDARDILNYALSDFNKRFEYFLMVLDHNEKSIVKYPHILKKINSDSSLNMNTLLKMDPDDCVAEEALYSFKHLFYQSYFEIFHLISNTSLHLCETIAKYPDLARSTRLAPDLEQYKDFFFNKSQKVISLFDSESLLRSSINAKLSDNFPRTLKLWEQHFQRFKSCLSLSPLLSHHISSTEGYDYLNNFFSRLAETDEFFHKNHKLFHSLIFFLYHSLNPDKLNPENNLSSKNKVFLIDNFSQTEPYVFKQSIYDPYSMSIPTSKLFEVMGDKYLNNSSINFSFLNYEFIYSFFQSISISPYIPDSLTLENYFFDNNFEINLPKKKMLTDAIFMMSFFKKLFFNFYGDTVLNHVKNCSPSEKPLETYVDYALSDLYQYYNNANCDDIYFNVSLSNFLFLPKINKYVILDFESLGAVPKNLDPITLIYDPVNRLSDKESEDFMNLYYWLDEIPLEKFSDTFENYLKDNSVIKKNCFVKDEYFEQLKIYRDYSIVLDRLKRLESTSSSLELYEKNKELNEFHVISRYTRIKEYFEEQGLDAHKPLEDLIRQYKKDLI